MKSYMVLHQLIHLSGPLDVYATSTSQSPFVTNWSLRRPEGGARLMTLFQGPAKLSNADDQTLLRMCMRRKLLTDIDS